MADHPLLAEIQAWRVFAVIRTRTAAEAVAAGRALVEGGVRLLEVTFTVEGALSAIEQLSREPGALVGAGTVLDPSQVSEAAAAGARFIVSPHLDPDLVAATRDKGLLSAAGGVTPTEAMACHRAGAHVVKIFPAVGFGPAYLKALRDPLPFLRLMPTGGVDESNLQAWLDAGAVGVGLGGNLVDKAAVARGDWGAITAKARTLAGLVASWQAKPAR